MRTAAELELDLDVFTGPFDLLLTLVLREEVDLLEVELADVVLTYLDFLESRGELDLEVATEFLVLIAALLELKSRLLLPREDEDLLELEPGEAAEELLARPRTPALTPAQAETLSIVAYLQPVSRPEVARIRGVSSDSAVASLTERGMIEERGRTQFGAVTYGTTPLFEKLFGLSGLDALPDPAQFDPTPADERELRERLLAAGEQRAA